MARTLKWSPRSRRNLDSIADYVAQDNPDAAARLVERIVKLIHDLLELPLIGRRVPEFDRDDIRERIHGNYRIVYRFRGELVEVMTIHHSSQKFPQSL